VTTGVTYRTIGVRDLDDNLVQAWRAVQARRSDLQSPYFCPEFTRSVGDVRDDVYVTIFEDGGRPIGFFPFQRAWAGRGRAVGGPMSDFHGVVAEPGSQWDLDALMRAAGLDVWTFDHLVGDDRGFDPHVRRRAGSPRIDLAAGFEEYARRRREAGSEYIGKTEGLARKMGREIGPLTFTLHEAGEEPLQRMIGWKRDQYRQAGIQDVFGVEWTSGLLRRILEIQTPGFAGQCSVLRAGDRSVAVHVGMRSREVLHYWFPAYDPALGKYSTGIILLLRMAEALAGQGVRTIDLGKGDSQYKQRLMTGELALREGVFTRPSLTASLLHWRELAETSASRGGAGAVLRLPLRALRRIEWARRFR